MSLINDALKRASQTEKGRAREPSLGSLMQPARPARRSGFPIGIVACVVLLLAASGWFACRYFAPSHPLPVAPAPVRTVIIPPAPAPVPAPVVKVEPAHVVASTPSPAVVAVPASSPRAPAAPVAVEPLPPFPELRIQAIFYSTIKPKVMISDQIYAENEQVGEVRIVKIMPAVVTTEWRGQTKEFRGSGR